LEGPQVDRAKALLSLYGRWAYRAGSPQVGRAIAEEAALVLIADVLHWFRDHGQDPDTALERARLHFEAEMGAAR
ncbi:ATP-binding protein, partial [Streptomyces sp. MCAF7]